MNKNKIGCKICEKSLASLEGLKKHITNSHPEIDQGQYYTQYINLESNYLCICGKRKKFINFITGFAASCGNKKCAMKQKTITMEKTCLALYGVKNPSQTKESKNKISFKLKNRTKDQKNITSKKTKKTKNERYGNENYNNKEKAKNTYFKKTGYYYNSQNPENKEKIKQTTLIKTNGKFTHPLQDIDNRIRNLVELKGVENVFQLEEVKKKSQESLEKKTGIIGIKNISQTPEGRELRKQLKKDYFKSSEYLQKRQNEAIEKIFNSSRLEHMVIPLFTKEDCTQVGNKLYLWKCTKCGNEFEYIIENGKIPRCLKCYPILTGTSKIEKEILEWVNKFEKAERKKFNSNGKIKEIDIYVNNKKFGIELDGLYFHSEISKFSNQKDGKDKNYHVEKTDFFKELGIDIIHILDIEWLNKKELIQSMILNKLGLIKNKIFARKCEIKIIDNFLEVKSFLEENHLQGSINSKVNLGLYFNSELIQLITLSKPRYNKNYEWEILRFCTKKYHSVVGGFSKLLSYFIENYDPKSIITYADLRISKGSVYLKNGFKFKDQTSPNYYYTKDYKSLKSRIEFQKHKLSKMLPVYDKNLTEWENMQLNGYDRYWDCGNLVFEWIKGFR